MTERRPVVLSEELYRSMVENMVGVCLECHAERDGTEPDAEDYHCDACGACAVIGLELALVSGLVDLTRHASTGSFRSADSD